MGEARETWAKIHFKKQWPCPGQCGSVGMESSSKLKGQTQFPVRAHAWVEGCPGRGMYGRPMFLSHIDVSLPFFLSPLPDCLSLSQKKQTNPTKNYIYI